LADSWEIIAKLRGLPADPAAGEDKLSYFAALRAADTGDPTRLRELWLERLEK
jgi:hypothetical protein